MRRRLRYLPPLCERWNNSLWCGLWDSSHPTTFPPCRLTMPAWSQTSATKASMPSSSSSSTSPPSFSTTSRRRYLIPRLVFVIAALLGLVQRTVSEQTRDFTVAENVPVGTLIGLLDGGHGRPPPTPPYLIVPAPGSAVDSDLIIDQGTREIRTKVVLDRESRSSYSFVAIPAAGENIRVVVHVSDENDNSPDFAAPSMAIEFPENTPRDVKRTLNPARDRDLALYNVQQYKIVAGNTNNAFRLSSHRERDEVLYLDLQVNGFLDRETTPTYSLVIEALDGGTPPLKGVMRVNITILDANDNQPIFNQSRYFANVAENATLGTSVLRVFATDADEGENGHVTYSINRRQSDRENFFVIDPRKGVISVNKPLDFETKDVYELVVVARDNGAQPLETTAFVTVRVLDVNDNQPNINLIFLSDDASPKISEDAQPGKYVARISVNDPDSKAQYSNVNVTLRGGDGHFDLKTRDAVIYFLYVNAPLDRETQSNFSLTVTATDQGQPPLQVSRTFNVHVTDINDNVPTFTNTVYFASVQETADPGTSVAQLTALDPDDGNNSAVIYSLKDNPSSSSSSSNNNNNNGNPNQWFQIDSKTGLITTRTHVDCEADPSPKVTVVASDQGHPPLSSSVTITITILDVNDNEPTFDQSFYNGSVNEDEAVGRCILTISASDADCGVNGMVNYTLGISAGKMREFEVQSLTGNICIASPLDHELRSTYEFPVIATDRGGESTTAMVKIQVADVNDNLPIFYPREYNVSLREKVTENAPVVVVVATDADSGRYGSVKYHIVSGNDYGLFRIDSRTGELFVTQQPSKMTPMHHLTVSATDGDGLSSEGPAHIWVSVIDSNQQPPIFKHSRYTLFVREDVPKHSFVGVVSAISADKGPSGGVRYSIYSGDPNSYFSIDPVTGRLSTHHPLDHERHPFVLLNVQAQSGRPPSYGHTQVNITIEDVNDNAPQFDSHIVKISVSENADLTSPIYAAHAEDIDSGENGTVLYDLQRNPGHTFRIDPITGYVTLQASLDYESQQKYTVVIGARDQGAPSLRSNMTLNVEVQDVNDNRPTFDKSEYLLNVLESEPVNAQLVQVMAKDRDTGNNARLTYKLKSEEYGSLFGIFPNNGWLYLKQKLDRETKERYRLTIVARDNGSPALSATCVVKVNVLDVNDNDPKFSQNIYVMTVQENLDEGTKVGTISAVDKDSGNNGALRYSLSTNASSFRINHLTGDIVTTKRLDREQQPVYELVLSVADQGTPARRDRAVLRVIVGDINDNAPRFDDPIDEIISVREEQAPGTEFVQMRAVDPDAGPNGTVTYSFDKIGDEDDTNAFEINSKTGVIATRAVLDHEQKQMYRLPVVAKDGGSPPLQTTRLLQIEVLDLNDNRPVFSGSSFSFRMRENTPLGEELGTVAAYDPDSGDNGRITYTIAGGNLYDTFEINKTSGTLFVVQEVDYEKINQYVLQVHAVDSSVSNPQESIINVTVAVDDVNDNAPMFLDDPILLTLRENVEPGSVVWNFTASDADSGLNGQVHYAILLQSPEEAFEMNDASGSLTLIKRLDYESHPEYMVVISATDHAINASHRLSTSATARIIVEDVNDNAPYFTSRSRVELMEDEPVGYPLAHLIALDRDSRENGKVTYAITSGNEDGSFALDTQTGLLTLAKKLNRKRSSHYVLNASATDNGRPSLSTNQMIDILVEDAEDKPPHFEKSIYVANVSEDASMGTYVVRVRAVDPDSGSNVNLTYFIPGGIAGDRFSIDPHSGEVRTSAPLDREEKSSYIITVYVRDASFPAQYDTATVLLDIVDVNDNSPEFHDSCYPLHVPENSELSVIHTVVAMDRDAGQNGEVTYSINEGNLGSKFSIDPHTGQLACAPLDRESVPVYKLMILARDRGEPTRFGYCNITVLVEDQNDNDPRFVQNRYEARIPEDAPINTTVLTVKATDVDEGVNARITYSLSNETQWLFKIDSETGAITTSGMFDREKKSSYNFEVRATDGGKYDARSEKTLVYVTISDVNDNKPLFQKYPLNVEVPANLPPGSIVVTVTAQDKDEGKNSEVVYSFVNEPPNSKFRIDPDTGKVVLVGSLTMDSGKMFHMEVLAQDKGNPPLSSTGVVEIRVGDNSETSSLKFQNATYRVQLIENAPIGTEVAQVKALRSDGKHYGITYSFGNGNEDDTFDINPNTGLIRVKDSRRLDFEVTQHLRLIVAAHADSLTPIYGYTTVWIDLLDQNDNPPRFTQDRYVSSVWEGQNKGTFVMQVSATDEDSGTNGNIIYHIVDGNYDNAFLIEPPFSGIVKTNIVLDREIRDVYRLTIIATDEGATQLTGTCTLRINIIDVNDNQPTFPPQSIVNVTEGAEVGTVITTITANDVDTNPALTYSFAGGGNPDQMFSIDRYSGKITLSQPLDHETKNMYLLTVEASDTTHTTQTTVTVNVIDENDNAPVFNQQSYQVILSEPTEIGVAIATVNATDEDAGDNARITYSMGVAPVEGFYIDENTGIVYANKTVTFDPKQPTIQLVITASDHGRPALAAVVAVRIQITDINNNDPKFHQQIYTTRISENAPRGTTVLHVMATDVDESQPHRNIYYSIEAGNEEKMFEISSNTGDIILVNDLDREVKAQYRLRIAARDRGSPTRNTSAEVVIYVDDINDNSPDFNQSDYVINVSEKTPVGRPIAQLYATDPDEGENALVKYDITSGNVRGMFELKSKSGLLILKKELDYERVREYKLIVRATDSNSDKPMTGIATVHINVEDENDNAPEFPVTQYLEFVVENAPAGTSVFTARAHDADKGMYGKLNYTIAEGDARHNFRIDSETGLVTTNVVFDYEEKNKYFFTIKTQDKGGKAATVRVQVDIESKDEYAPEFSRNSYQFSVPGSAQTGYIVGRLQAKDRDKGPDGRVVYTLREPHANFRINRTTGVITVKAPFKHNGNRKQRDVKDVMDVLLVTASSGKPNSLFSTAEVVMSIGFNLTAIDLNDVSQDASTGLAGWALGLVIALAVLAIGLFTVILFLRLRNRRSGKPALAHEFDSSFDTIDIRPPPSASNIARYPPRYNDLHHYDTAEGSHHANTTSEISDQSHSASSGRGSAEDGEDGEDEEIRMINEGPLMQQQKLRERLGMPDSGIQNDDDNLSDISVHNTQEYLARLGIKPSSLQHTEPPLKKSGVPGDFDKMLGGHASMESMHMFDDEGGGEGDGMDISNLIYAKLNEVGAEENDAIMDGTRAFGFGDESHPSMTGSLSSIVHSEEELTGSYNWDYLLDWGPRYQPLAHVFAEIARLKDDTAPQAYNPNHPPKKTLNSQVKTIPPPLLTAVAPRSIAPVALSSARTSQLASMPSLPRSPISHESSFTSLALSPSFSPSLSPLATRSPSISPLVTPGAGGGNSSQTSGNSTPHHSQSHRSSSLVTSGSSGSETELQI